MSTSSTPTIDKLSDEARRHVRSRCKSNGERHWTAANTVTMIAGFVFFWPAGLLVLFWILSGRHVRELPQAMRTAWASLSGAWPGSGAQAQSDNVVFNDYQSTQYERIREIRDEISERARRFNEYRAEGQRRIDQEEFDRFMASSPQQSPQ